MTRYGDAGCKVHSKPAGTVMTVAFELDGQAFTALNGGPLFTFNESLSFQVQYESGNIDATLPLAPLASGRT